MKNGIRIPAGKYYLIDKLSPAKISYDNSIALMDFRLKQRKQRKSLVERGVVEIKMQSDGYIVGIYVYGYLVSLGHGTPGRKEIESIFDTVIAMEKHYAKE